MAADNVKRFEFRMGKWGLGLFVAGMSLLVFFSFLFGVNVGKDMDAYPEKYSWGIPNRAMETLGTSGTSKSDKTIVAVREAGKENPPSEKSEYDLSFYDTLSKKSNSLKKQSSENESTEKAPIAPVPPSKEKTAAVSAAPSVAVTALIPGNKPAVGKKEEKAVVAKEKEREAKRLHPGKLETASQGRGEEKIVAKAIPEKVREVKTHADENKTERKLEKTIPAEKKADSKIDKIIAADKKAEKSQDRKEIKQEEKGKKPAGQTFMVQVGSYRDKEKAEQVASKLKTLGYAPRLVPMELPGKGKWYRLTIGGFASHDKAAEAVTNVGKSVGGPKGFIRPEGEAKSASSNATIPYKISINLPLARVSRMMTTVAAGAVAGAIEPKSSAYRISIPEAIKIDVTKIYAKTPSKIVISKTSLPTWRSLENSNSAPIVIPISPNAISVMLFNLYGAVSGMMQIIELPHNNPANI